MFPPVELALKEPNGLLAAGGDLSAVRLLNAYQHGIFPWFNADDPILWWSPDPRMVLVPSEFKLSKSLAKVLRNASYQVTFDTAFEQVMRACAAPRRDQAGTWIHDDMIAAYVDLFRLGYAHSVEVWQEGLLVGGLYGLALGQMFYGESMFSRVNNGSKIALARLCQQLARWSFELIDCQMNTRHLASLGGREISRADFMQQLNRLTALPAVSRWQFDVDLDVRTPVHE